MLNCYEIKTMFSIDGKNLSKTSSKLVFSEKAPQNKVENIGWDDLYKRYQKEGMKVFPFFLYKQKFMYELTFSDGLANFYTLHEYDVRNGFTITQEVKKIFPTLGQVMNSADPNAHTFLVNHFDTTILE